MELVAIATVFGFLVELLRVAHEIWREDHRTNADKIRDAGEYWERNDC